MAGAIDAYRNVTNDPLWIIKLPILAIPVFLYFYDPQTINAIFGDKYVYFTILYIFYLGVSSIMIHRNIKNKIPILPSFFSIFGVLNRMIGCTIVCFIPSVLFIIATYLIDSTLKGYEDFVLIILKIIAFLILVPFICVPTVIYSVNGKLMDLFKVKNILTLSSDFMSAFINYVIQCIFIFGFITFCFYGALAYVWGKDFIGIHILFSIMIVLLFLMFFAWSSDLYGQIIPEIPEKKRKDKALRETF